MLLTAEAQECSDWDAKFDKVTEQLLRQRVQEERIFSRKLKSTLPPRLIFRAVTSVHSWMGW